MREKEGGRKKQGETGKDKGETRRKRLKETKKDG